MRRAGIAYKVTSYIDDLPIGRDFFMADLYGGCCMADLYGGFVWRILAKKFVWRNLVADLHGGFWWAVSGGILHELSPPSPVTSDNPAFIQLPPSTTPMKQHHHQHHFQLQQFLAHVDDSSVLA